MKWLFDTTESWRALPGSSGVRTEEFLERGTLEPSQCLDVNKGGAAGGWWFY